ncbi:MAG: carboxypeptidase-like regulatory domain-containing protein [Bacteroidetes bacterium]|nr:carboxypeptidase-like regulatory domain-containing protein [Bacteroidota bacterium]
MKIKYFFLLLILFIIPSCSENTVEPILYGNLSGVVLSPDGKTKISGASVTTSPPSNAIITNGDGEFKIENVPVGNYVVTANKSGYSKGSVSIAINNSETTDAVIFLNINSDYTSPGMPEYYAPADQAENQPLSITLSWYNQSSSKNSIDTTWFDVYLMESGTTLSNKIASNIVDTNVSIKNLNYNTTYYWQVIAKGRDTAKVYGKIWSFKTKSIPNNPIVLSKLVNGSYEIFSSDINGDNLVQLTSTENRNWYPRMNSRYNKIAFTTDIEVEPQIYTINKDGSGLFKVSTISVAGYNNYGMGICWSPDGAYIIYPHYDKLYRINMDGTNLTLIANAPPNRNFKDCDWTSVGNKIVVQTIGINVYDSEIYLMNADGSDFNLLVGNMKGKLDNPSFSIDGKKVLYTYDITDYQNSQGRSLESHIFSISVGGKDTVDLSFNKYAGTNDANPRYSSDGSKIIFTNCPNDGSALPDVWIMNADGSHRSKIITNGTMPDWR